MPTGSAYADLNLLAGGGALVRLYYTPLSLRIDSAHGSAVPGVGTNLYPYGVTLTCIVSNSPIYVGAQATQYVGFVRGIL